MRCTWLGMTLLAVVLLAPAAPADTFNIEIDYMVDIDHTHRPSAAVINAVVKMFQCQGHTLNIVVDDALTHRDVMVRNPATCGDFFGYNNGSWNSYGYIKQRRFDRNLPGWHYCVFGHQYQKKDANGNCVTSGSSGLATGARILSSPSAASPGRRAPCLTRRLRSRTSSATIWASRIAERRTAAETQGRPIMSAPTGRTFRASCPIAISSPASTIACSVSV